jgi:DNA-binding transcriptional MerR regulator
MLIGELSSRSGFSRHALRYYEKLGLLTSRRSSLRANNYREYTAEALKRLRQIQQLKTLGFTLEDMADLFRRLDDSPEPCASLPSLLDQKMEALDQKLALLSAYRHRLGQVRKACQGTCDQVGAMPDCLAHGCC